MKAKKVLGLVMVITIIMSLVIQSYADENKVFIINSQLKEISSFEKGFDEWNNANLELVSFVYNYDSNSIYGELYHLKNDSNYLGYIILSSDNKILEFSKGNDPYSRFFKGDVESYDTAKLLYSNGMPAILKDHNLIQLSINGRIVSNSELELMSQPHQQSGNCIVGAISNLIWHNDINGFPNLVSSGMSFVELEDEIDNIINGHGGYSNNNIPITIIDYTSIHSNYSVNPENNWYPNFSDVKNETDNGYACLLGFAPGSPYSDTVGHMTVCIDTIVTGTANYVKLLDGWKDYPVYKAWGSYNDFYCKVRFNE